MDKQATNNYNGHTFNTPVFRDEGPIYETITCTKCGQHAKQLKWKPEEIVYYDENWKRIFDNPICPKSADIDSNFKPSVQKDIVVEKIADIYKFRHKFTLISVAPDGTELKGCDCGIKCLVKDNVVTYIAENGITKANKPYRHCNINHGKVGAMQSKLREPKKNQTKTIIFAPIQTNTITSTPQQLIEEPEKAIDLLKDIVFVEAPKGTIDKKKDEEIIQKPYPDRRAKDVFSKAEPWKELIEKGFETALPKIPTVLPELKESLTNDEARLVEAYAVINLMFEDLVKNNIYCTSREMAGRLLYSANYSERVKQLKQK